MAVAVAMMTVAVYATPAAAGDDNDGDVGQSGRHSAVQGCMVLDLRNVRGVTALHIAAANGRIEMREALLANGASAPYV